MSFDDTHRITLVNAELLTVHFYYRIILLCDTVPCIVLVVEMRSPHDEMCAENAPLHCTGRQTVNDHAGSFPHSLACKQR